MRCRRSRSYPITSCCTNLVRGQSAPALKGDYTLEQALHQLLSRTHLSYEITADGLVLIRAPAAATTSRSRLPQYTPSRARGSQSQVMVSSWGFWQWPRTGELGRLPANRIYT